jgi:hypothetical protein
MSNLVKYCLVVSLGCILIFHFVFIFIYASPFKTTNLKLSGYSQKYVYPLFHQSWSLFVPVPTNKNYLFVKTNNNSKWELLFPIKLSSMSHSTLIGEDAISLLFSNSIVYELNVLPQKSTIYNSKPTNQEFEILNYEICNFLKLHKYINNASKYEILLLSNSYNGQLIYKFKNLHSLK